MRSLLRTPGFALIAIITLALGIGLATAVFTVADAVLVRRLPVRDQARLVVLWGRPPGQTFNAPLGLDDVREFARRSRSFDHVASVSYYGAVAKPIRDGDQISSLSRAAVSGEFFDVLGVRPTLGRGLRAADDVTGAAPVAVLSYGTWQRRFGGDSAILGRQLRTFDDGIAYTIVGVMPQGLAYPRGTDFWTPIVPSMLPNDVYVIGRLAPRATILQARDEMTAFLQRADAPAGQRNLRGDAHTLPSVVLGETRPAIVVFAIAAGVLLLITCMNVANLLLVRGIARVREIAVRSALGAGRRRIVLQLLTENAFLALAGGLLGVVIASAAVRTFVASAPAGMPRLDEIQLNGTALIGATVITALAMLVFGLAPALMTSRVELQQVLGSGTRHSPSRRSRLLTEGLVAAQVALAMLVLAAAGLLAKSLIKLEKADLAFESSHLLIGELTFRYDRFSDAKRQRALLERIVSQLQMVPGVRAASPVVANPFSGSSGWDGRPAAEGQSRDEITANPILNMEVVAPAYFETFGISVLRGRGFTASDRVGAPGVVMLSESAARYYWPGGDPVGKRVLIGPDLEQSVTVIGVVPDTRYRELRDARASIYFPLSQSTFPYLPTSVALRTTGPPNELVPVLRRAIAELDPGVALASAAPFETFLERPLAQPRLNAFLLTVFAGAALALAAVGLFAVMMTMVRQRTRELGIRLTLGATTGDLSRMVLRRGLTVAAAGLAVGLVAAVFANRLLVAVLYQVSPTDGVTLAVVTVLLLIVASLASLLPARLSTRVDPIIVLRGDG
jgi:putative ABC transport system permease protein